MTKAVYVHQWDQLGERTLEAFAATCVAGGVTEVRPRAAEAANRVATAEPV
jgi:hypothetical protein